MVLLCITVLRCVVQFAFYWCNRPSITGMQSTQPYRHGTCCFASVTMPPYLITLNCFKAKSYHGLNRESNQIKRILQQMARASTRTSQISTLLEVHVVPLQQVHVVPLQQLLKLIMMKEVVTLNGAAASDNWVNTRCSSATALYHDSTLPTPGLALGFVIGVLDTGRARKKKIQLV